MSFTKENVRNLLVAGHGGSGKTSLVEALVYATKGTDRLGRTDDGNTVCDFEPEEIRRKASLSLALGLSDAVQMSAGGIRVETLFIDEGFGSLDADSLQQAIRVLEGLMAGDVMVGVISHVDLLRERIDRKVEVTRTREGSVVRVVTD